MVIGNAILLQVDITAIVGIFIFVTIAQVKMQEQKALLLLTSILVIPFAVSALFILIEDFLLSEYFVTLLKKLSIPMWGAISGFAYIILVFGYIFVKQLKQPKHKIR